MSVFNGKRIKAEIYGASRGEKIGVKISGLDGFSFDENKLKDFLKRRSPSDKVYSTARKERDIPVFSGEITGKITGKITSRITGEITNEIAGGVTERKIGGEFSCEIFNEDAEKSDLKKASGKNEVGPEYGKETVICRLWSGNIWIIFTIGKEQLLWDLLKQVSAHWEVLLPINGKNSSTASLCLRRYS